MSSSDKKIYPEIRENPGTFHPINQTKDYLLNILRDIGFEEISGPEIETEKYNFRHTINISVSKITISVTKIKSLFTFINKML